MEKAVAVGVGIVGPSRIDEINILQATYEAMRLALDQLKVTAADAAQRRCRHTGCGDSAGADCKRRREEHLDCRRRVLWQR